MGTLIRGTVNFWMTADDIRAEQEMASVITSDQATHRRARYRQYGATDETYIVPVRAVEANNVIMQLNIYINIKENRWTA